VSWNLPSGLAVAVSVEMRKSAAFRRPSNQYYVSAGHPVIAALDHAIEGGGLVIDHDLQLLPDRRSIDL